MGPSGEEISISQVSEPERTKLIKALPDKHSKEEETIIHVESLEPSTTFDGKSESHEIIKAIKKTKVGNKILTKILKQKDGQEPEVISEILNLPSGQEVSLTKLPALERKLFEEKIPEKFVEQMIISEEPKEICELISSKQTIQAIEPTKIVKKVKKAKVGNKTIMQVTEQINDEKPEITTEIVILPTGEEINSSQVSEPERTKLIKALPDKYSKEEEIITHVETIEPSSNGIGKSEPKEVKKIIKKTKVGNKILTKVFEQKDNQEPEVISEILTLPSGQEVSSNKLPAFERKLFEEKIPEKFVEQIYTVEEPEEICEPISSKQTVQEIEPAKIVKKVKKAKVGNKTIMQVTEQVNDEKPEITTEIVILPTGEEISISQVSEPERTKLIKALPDKYSKEEEIITHVETIEPPSIGI